MVPRPDLAQQSWRDVSRTYRQFAAVDGTDYSALHDVIEHIASRQLSARLHASTSHDLLNIATAHRADAGADVIRLSVQTAEMRLEYFDGSGTLASEESVPIAESIPSLDALLDQLIASSN
jgi:hypothetical protein